MRFYKFKKISCFILALIFALSSCATVFAQNKALTVSELIQKFITEASYENSRAGFNANDEAAYKALSYEQRDIINETNNLTITVDETNTWDYNYELFGVQMSWADHYDTFYSDGNLKDSFLEFVETTADVPVFRWGGYQVNHHNFMLNLGPFEQRKGTPGITTGMYAGFEGYPAYKMGPVEFLKVMYANNPDAQLIVGLSQYVYSDQDVEDLCHFLMDEPTTEWGKYRASLGIENPVKIFYWEMGNEVDKYTEEGRQFYIDVVRRQVEIIRSIDPDAKICVSCPTAPWGRTSVDEDDDAHWSSWHRKVMPKLADVVDAIAFHPYYDGHSAEYNYTFIDTIKKDLDKMVEELDIRDKDGNLKEIYILGTEGARWSNPNSDDPSTVTFQAAISNSHFLNLAFQRPWYIGNMLHDLCNFHLWGYWALKNDDEWLKTPTEKLYGMYMDNVGDKVVKTSWCWEGDEDKEFDIYNSETFSTVAFREGKNKLKVFLTNKKAHRDINVSFNFKANYKLTEETYITAPNLVTWSYNKECEELTKVITNEKNEANFTSYHLAPQTVVVLTLETDADLKKLAGDVDEEETLTGEVVEMESAFLDTDNHWAKNEIAYLKENGIASGKSETSFEPDTLITKAEFSAMLSRSLSLKEDYKGNIFEDVNENDWYYKYANALYFEGIETNSTFNPNDNVSFIDACKMFYKAYLAKGGTAYANTNLIPQAYNDKLLDEDKISFAFCIEKSYAQRLYENSNLELSKNITRAEAAAMMYRLIKNS